MSSAPLWQTGATALGTLFQQRTVSPVDFLDALLARIEAVNPALNALVTLDATVRAQALESTQRIAAGRARSSLEGVPIAIKDNILTAGLRTTWGSRILEHHVPEVDELPVARLRAAGAIILGKTNVPEFTLEGYTSNLLFGTTRNPWNTALTPGGSSGGAVAGVAGGLFPLALGTDGGGSIRRPASHTGVVGFKPSIGAIARYPTLPQILLDFEVIGPIARSVDDAHLLYKAIAGPDPYDRHSMWQRSDAGSGETLRILFVPRFGSNPLDPQIDASVRMAAVKLQRLHHRVEEGTLPFSLDFVTEFWPVLGQVGVALLFDRYPQAAQLAAPKYREMSAAGHAVPASRYLDYLDKLDTFRRQVTAAFETVDVIMTPSAAALPWPADEAFPPVIDGRPVGPRGHAIYTAWVNACGHPAIALPSDPADSGAPIGFQLIGRFGADERLFQLAREFEQARPWAQRWPAM